MWLKLGHFLRSWAKFLGRRDVDNWGAQAAAEGGKGDNAFVQPLAYLAVTFTVLVLTWLALPLLVKEIALWFAWPALAVLAAIQTVAMAVRLTRRHRGFRV